MPDDAQSLCELWDVERAAIPEHSRLYYEAPIGLGSPSVESLTSYVARLAAAHSVHPRTLVTEEILPLLSRSYLYQAGRPIYNNLTALWKDSAALNGNHASTSEWVQVLERLTLRRDLRFLTMLSWVDVLSPRELLRRTRAWCPVCYEERRRTGQVVYEPLLFALEVVSVCPSHRLQLHLRCPYQDCGSPQPPLAPRFQPGYCVRCDRWLGCSSQSEDSQVVLRDGEWVQQWWVGNAVGELLAAAPSLPAPPTREGIAGAITAAYEEGVRGNMSALARWLQMHPSTTREWMHGQQIPQLGTLVQICSHFGVSPLRLLTGNPAEVAATLKHAPDENMTGEKPKRRYRKFDKESLRRALEGVLQNPEAPPPSMREVAQHLGYDQSHLYQHFPELCQAISARYLDYQAAKRAERLQRMCNEVQQAVRDLHEQGKYPSERQVKKLLRTPGALKEHEVRVFWQDAILELGWR